MGDRGTFFACDGHSLTSLDKLAGMPPTDDKFKYSYQRLAENRYGFLQVDAKVLGFITWKEGCQEMSVDTKSTAKAFHCVTGNTAEAARETGIELVDQIVNMSELVERVDQAGGKAVLDEFDNEITAQHLLNEATAIHQQLSSIATSDSIATTSLLVPYTVRCEVQDTLEELLRYLRKYDRASSKALMMDELKSVIEKQDDEPAIVHAFTNGPGETKLNLSRLTNVVKDKPVLVLAVNQMGQLSAACLPAAAPSVPQPSGI